MRTQRRAWLAAFFALIVLTPYAAGQIISSGQIAVSPPPTLTIQRLPVVGSVTIAPATVAYGQGAVGTVFLTATATVNIDVSLTTSEPVIASVQSTVTVPAGQTSASFSIKTGNSAVGVVTITASTGMYPKTAQLSVGPPPVEKILFRLAMSSWSEGQPLITGEVSVYGAVSGMPFTIPLSVDNPSLVSVPPSLSFPAGTNVARFPIDLQPVANNTSVMVTAGSGSGAKSAPLALSAGPSVQAIGLNPSTLADGLSATRETMGITLSQFAAYPFVMSVVSDHPEAVPPQKVYCPAMYVTEGPVSLTRYLTTKRVNADTSITLMVGNGAGAKTGTFIIKGPSLTGLLLAGQTSGTNVATVGSSSLGISVNVNPAAGPGGLTFAIASSDPKVPGGIVTIPENATSGAVTIQTPSVSSPLPVTFSTTLKGISKSATATLMPK